MTFNNIYLSSLSQVLPRVLMMILRHASIINYSETTYTCACMYVCIFDNKETEREDIYKIKPSILRRELIQGQQKDSKLIASIS